MDAMLKKAPGEGSDACLELGNQLCFPIYLAAKEIITRYGVLLAPLSLTYTQYLVMLVLWQYPELDMRRLGEMLFLNSSTLTPVVNRLIEKGYLSKERDTADKRLLKIRLEAPGAALHEQALKIPPQLYREVKLSEREALDVKHILQKIIRNLTEQDAEK